MQRFRQFKEILKELFNFLKSPSDQDESPEKKKNRKRRIAYILCTLGILILFFTAFYIDQRNNLRESLPDKNEVVAEEIPTPELIVRQKRNEKEIKDIALSISFVAQTVFDSHKMYFTLCRDGVLATNLPTIESYVKTLLILQGKENQADAGIRCMATGKYYAVSIEAKPPQVTKAFSSCIDSTGFVGNGKISLKPLACIQE